MCREEPKLKTKKSSTNGIKVFFKYIITHKFIVK